MPALIDAAEYSITQEVTRYTERRWVNYFGATPDPGDPKYLLRTEETTTRIYTWAAKQSAGHIAKQDPDSLEAAGWEIRRRENVPYGSPAGTYQEIYTDTTESETEEGTY